MISIRLIPTDSFLMISIRLIPTDSFLMISIRLIPTDSFLMISIRTDSYRSFLMISIRLIPTDSFLMISVRNQSSRPGRPQQSPQRRTFGVKTFSIQNMRALCYTPLSLSTTLAMTLTAEKLCVGWVKICLNQSIIWFKGIHQNILDHPVRLFPPGADAIGSFIIRLLCCYHALSSA